MKQYVIDEIRLEDHEKVKNHLDSTLGDSGSPGLYWFPVDESMLTETQAAHETCKPLCFSLELEETKLSCELLIRTLNRIRCDCIAYATEEQRNWFIGKIDAMFQELEIIA